MINLAICLCFKNASHYLDEWLAYYRALGADYFYLYDNNSSDEYVEVIRPYLKEGLAELHRWPGLGEQHAIYTDCLKRARRRAHWLAFLDDDEFLWPVHDPDLPSAFKRYENYAGVAVCWYLFGSSHHKTRPKGLVIENFTWRAPGPDPHVKCVVSPARVQRPLVIGHSFVCEPGFTVVDEHLRNVSNSTLEAPSGNLLRINHYATKSLEEMRLRRTQPQADTGKVTVHDFSRWEYWAESWSQTQDIGIQRFIPKVRQVQQQMAAIRKKETIGSKYWTKLKRAFRGISSKKSGAV